ncbi:MAG TPA: hypothetical protein VI072_10765 [Polyangiaceae bacterium]
MWVLLAALFLLLVPRLGFAKGQLVVGEGELTGQTLGNQIEVFEHASENLGIEQAAAAFARFPHPIRSSAQPEASSSAVLP